MDFPKHLRQFLVTFWPIWRSINIIPGRIAILCPDYGNYPQIFQRARVQAGESLLLIYIPGFVESVIFYFPNGESTMTGESIVNMICFLGTP
jgi:hypothetical protein